jgi:ribosomal peptide maturation radical SAM protein 1
MDTQLTYPKGQEQTTSVLLISMPFGPAFCPSLGLSLLKQTLVNQQPQLVHIEYFNLMFAALVGPKLYSEIAAGVPTNHDLFGEWLFAKSLFGEVVKEGFDNEETYIEQILLGSTKEHSKRTTQHQRRIKRWVDKSLNIRQQIEPFLSACLQRVQQHQPAIVGFTSVFQQQVASLSLARRIKQWNPNTTIVFGGANNEATMGKEVIRQFPFVDIVVSGEGEIIFPELVNRLLTDRPIDDLAGVFTQTNLAFDAQKAVPITAPMVRNMDSLPIPVYDDYFDQLAVYGLTSTLSTRLLFETSRGCWWGEVSHCTFCGLNGNTMLHRSKSPNRAFDELRALTEKYPGHDISVVDNILEMKYFKDFIPLLIQQQLGIELFYEVKANLSKEQVKLLRQAGITTIQPGIESLSDSVLKLMGKGVKSIQNIQLLKWCKEAGVKPLWNMIWGFPGEPETDYEQMAKLVPYLVHLEPPGGYSTLRLDRFSPNFNHSTELGFAAVYPYPSYSYVYPFNSSVLNNLSYYFAYSYLANKDPKRYTQSLVKSLKNWQKKHEASDLFYVEKAAHLLVWDFRFEQDNLFVLTDLQKHIYVYCDSAKTSWQLHELMRDLHISLEELPSVLTQLISRNLLFFDGVHYLSLAIPLGTYTPNVAILRRLQTFIELHLMTHSASSSEATIDLNKFLVTS